ncbi:hypothetical protein CYLTODRAFT_387548 [Cylindrobasidium torrendii FP15055 ss-10]|uniref:Hemerythrin-like domain-containing protein n=1 Tax=Cylindrobasidium torrendii FP15055 ss-10 TaxID=1314674 RepID=A0A0D7BRA6_9AGAR|nr:hypothetical protein CYLTODRAFT_387548 [Cylindrobasidium torrendii FP15055 ss-10]
MEEAKWNSLADRMSMFHDHFKHEFTSLYEMADGSFSKRGLNLGLYLQTARQFEHYLTVHHTIEERHIFPVLAKKMPAFQHNEEHLKSHEGIHDGLEKLKTLLHKWKLDPKSYSPEEMRGCLDGFREVLFRHLDDEVKDLGAENMKKYWTLDEVARIPM